MGSEKRNFHILYGNFQIFYKMLVLESFKHYSHFIVLIKLYCNCVDIEPVAKGVGRNENLFNKHF